jgi:hypothetical protein
MFAISRRRAAALAVLLATTASTAWATDCNVNVYNAYDLAKQRGWTFQCFWNLPGGSAKLMPFGPTIGCVVNTPPVAWSPLPGFNPQVLFFSKSSGLKNGWSFKGYEVSGAQWQTLAASDVKIYDDHSLIRAGLKQLQPAKKYSVTISKMTLSKSGGSCSKAIDEAF